MKKLSAYILSLVIISGLSIQSSLAQDGETNKTAEIKVQTTAMCGMCKTKIEDKLNSEKGVIEASLDMETKIATIKYKISKTDPVTIKNSIASLGYDADDIKADAKAYDNLPACCKKK